MDQKDKKITALKNLLAEAKAKMQQKDNLMQEQQRAHSKKVQALEDDAKEIMKQYEERFLRSQKSLEDAQQMTEKHLRLSQTVSKNYDELRKRISGLASLTARCFASAKHSEREVAVQELYEVQKCKQYKEELTRMRHEGGLEGLINSMAIIVGAYQSSLTLRRDCRLAAIKRQALLDSSLVEERMRAATSLAELQKLRVKLSQMQQRYRKELYIQSQSREKQNQESINRQFIKQLTMKLLMGPKEASMMALEVLTKVLQLTAEEKDKCMAKLK